jgi:cysteinyl-tRNA synthetase
VGGEKMSKSLGNFTTIRALLDSGVSPMTLRLFVLQAHYRKPLDFTAEALDAAAAGWKGLNAALALAGTAAGQVGPTSTSEPDAAGTPSASSAITPARPASDPAGLPADLAAPRTRFAAAMDDDLNTSAALAVLFELARPLRALAHRLERGDAAAAAEAAGPELRRRGALLAELAAVLGLKHEVSAPPGAGVPAGARAGAGAGGGEAGVAAAAIEALIAERRAAKASRDFATADRIRAQLREQGIELIDKPGGVTEWLRG